MDVSENSGTPKSSILIGLPIINHPFWGTPGTRKAHQAHWHALSLSLGEELCVAAQHVVPQVFDLCTISSCDDPKVLHSHHVILLPFYRKRLGRNSQKVSFENLRIDGTISMFAFSSLRASKVGTSKVESFSCQIPPWIFLRAKLWSSFKITKVGPRDFSALLLELLLPLNEKLSLLADFLRTSSASIGCAWNWFKLTTPDEAAPAAKTTQLKA